MLIAALVVGAMVAGVCLAWPWYSFAKAVRWRQDNDYWFNKGILRVAFTQWCAPGLLCALFVLPMRNRPLVRTCLVGGAAAFGIGLVAIFIKSAALARFPVPGLIFFHLALGVFVHESGIFRPATWPARLRAMLSPGESAPFRAILEATVAVLMLYFLVP